MIEDLSNENLYDILLERHWLNMSLCWFNDYRRLWDVTQGPLLQVCSSVERILVSPLVSFRSNGSHRTLQSSLRSMPHRLNETNSCMNIFPLDAAVVQVSNPVLLTSESQPLLNSLSQTLFRENINKDEHKEKED